MKSITKLGVLILSLLAGPMAFAQTINSVSPNTGEKGSWTLPITITGSGTSFSSATSTVLRIKQGADELEVLAINNVEAETVEADIRISNLKPTGAYSVEVYDSNDGLINLSNGFTVSSNSNAPSFLTTTPEAGSESQMLPVTISMENTHFAQATDNTIYLTQGTFTIMPVPGSIEALNDNYLKAMFDLDVPYVSNGDILDSHFGNSHDGYFSDYLAINVTELTTINGIVIYGGTYNGVVELYQKNVGVTPATYSLVATVNVDGSNNYSFSGVANAEYLMRSVPVGMADVVATYFPNAIDWTSSTLVQSDPLNVTTADITPFNSIDLTGGVTVNGTLGWGPNGFTKAASVVLAEGVEVFIQDVNNTTYAQATTDANGLYTFSNVPNGNYQIVVNLPGYSQIDTYDFVVNDNSTTFDELDFLIDDHEIFKSGFLSVSKDFDNDLVAFPNPTNGKVFIQMPHVFGNFSADVYNMTGQKIWDKTVTGNNVDQFNVDLTDLPAGMYFVKVQSDSEVLEIRVVKE
jgi:Secretion system C-terminal sorting domain/Carboxypeptidase regulatory-like domain